MEDTTDDHESSYTQIYKSATDKHVISSRSKACGRAQWQEVGALLFESFACAKGWANSQSIRVIHPGVGLAGLR
jgi:hypothetical protein